MTEKRNKRSDPKNMTGQKERTMAGKRFLNWFDRWMMAISFAETGEHQTALRCVEPEKRAGRRKSKKNRVEKRSSDRPELRM